MHHLYGLDYPPRILPAVGNYVGKPIVVMLTGRHRSFFLSFHLILCSAAGLSFSFPLAAIRLNVELAR